ncbi:hypothetical protein MRX96_020095 [Rhipicephalus microplus]
MLAAIRARATRFCPPGGGVDSVQDVGALVAVRRRPQENRLRRRNTPPPRRTSAKKSSALLRCPWLRDETKATDAMSRAHVVSRAARGHVIAHDQQYWVALLGLLDMRLEQWFV